MHTVECRLGSLVFNIQEFSSLTSFDDIFIAACTFLIAFQLEDLFV